MRNILLLATAALFLGACSDDQHPSAPASSRNADRFPAASLSPSPQAKPIDQVGFTKITRVLTQPHVLPAGEVAEATAVCPDGTVLTGGGYSTSVFPNLSVDARPYIADSWSANGNGWYVRAFNNATGATEIIFWAYALCAS